MMIEHSKFSIVTVAGNLEWSSITTMMQNGV